MKRRRALIFSLLASALLVCIASGLVMRGYWREQAGRELILAIKANDTGRALDALRAHADPNVRDEGDKASSLRDYLSTLWLRMRGIKPIPPNRGMSALGLSVHEGNAVVVEALLAGGAKALGEKCEEEVEIPDGGRHFETYPSEATISLMETAARHGNAAIIQALARHGCDVNEANNERATPLFFAANAETVKSLIACGADLAARNSAGRTALDYNIWAADEDVADVLLENGLYDPAAMQDVIEFDHLEPLQRMLGLGWKIDTLDQHKATPLMNALASGRSEGLDAALILIAHGANVNHQDARGTTPLMLAAEGGLYPSMQEQSPLVIEAHLVMETLLKHGARIDVQDAAGRTPLMTSALHLRPVLVRLLLKHGARVNLKTSKGETALSMVLRSDYARDYASPDNDRLQSEVIRLLRNAGAKE